MAGSAEELVKLLELETLEVERQLISAMGHLAQAQRDEYLAMVALYKAMGGFATNGVNMTKLESYMVGGSFSATQFYADVEGHPDDRALELALGHGSVTSLLVASAACWHSPTWRRQR